MHFAIGVGKCAPLPLRSRPRVTFRPRLCDSTCSFACGVCLTCCIQLDGGVLSLNVPDTNDGMFAIVSTGTISIAGTTSGYESACSNGCGRLICVRSLTNGAVPVSFTAGTSCGNTTLVVGYAQSYTAGQTLKFATIDTCDIDNIDIPGLPTATTTTSDNAATTCAAAATAVTAAVAGYVMA